MIVVVLGLCLVLLTPVYLGALAWLRARQRGELARADLASFLESSGFRGSVEPELRLHGEVDGAACYVSTDAVGEGQARQRYLRARVLANEPDGYRAAPGRGDAIALVIGRDAPTPTDRVVGLAEVGSGDAALDAAYRCFLAPGARAPWSDPGVRRALVASATVVARAELGPLESSVALSPYFERGAFIRRAVALAAAISSPARAERRRADLDAPFDPRPPPEESRLKWAVARVLAVTFLALVFMVPFLFASPVLALTERIACDAHEHVATVVRGRGATDVCVGPRGSHDVNGWVFLISIDGGLVTSLLVFTGIERVVRARRS